MLTTTVDGLWVLQVLSNIEVLAPELGLRPHLPSVETVQMALNHPVAVELCAAGVITGSGAIDPVVLEWLTVLSRRDVALLIYAQTPDADINHERILLARFAQWWVTLERCGAVVRVSSAGITSTESSAGILINSTIENFCGVKEPATIRPVTVNATDLVAAVTDPLSLQTFLKDQKLDAGQMQTLVLAADPERSAQVSVIAIQSGTGTHSTRTHINPEAVTIIDTPVGRLVSEHLARADKSWLMVSPGTRSAIGGAVQGLMRRLPARDDWSSYRKVV